MKKAVLVSSVLFVAGTCFLSCGGYSKPKGGPPSGLTTRVLASQSVAAGSSFPGLVIVNAENDSLPRAAPIGAGSFNVPGLMALSATRATLLVFDSGTNAVQIVDTTKESNSGSIALSGSTTSMVIPTQSASIGFAAVPTASLNGILSTAGAVVVMNLASNSINATIGVPDAQTVVSNAGGTQVLAFSSDSDSMAVISPGAAVGPVDQGCDSGSLSTACVLVPGFNRPVFAIYSSDGSTAYVLNCGMQCGGTQPASVAVVDTATFTVTNSIAVDGATWAFLSGTTLYVVGTSPLPANNDCAGQMWGNPPQQTAATVCGRLDIVDLSSLSVINATQPIKIPDGYHDRMDMSSNGQLFIGSHTCTTVGDVNNPVGEVRGCLAIYNTSSGNVVIPPDNGDVTGLQSFTSRYVEYVCEGGNLRVYDSNKDILLINTDFLPAGTVPIVGVVVDVKAIDFF